MTPDVFYPIVPDADWIKRLVPLGIKTIQLRMKNECAETVAAAIATSLDICRQHGCQLIVNDYWQEAISAGADFVHLGQEDLQDADIAAIKHAEIQLGISTHSEAELANACLAEPDYIALGPIYETKLKKMKWEPQGLTRITEWKKKIGALPLVAIGGITPERAPDIITAGADSVAVITDFMTAPHPEARIKLWLDWADEVR